MLTKTIRRIKNRLYRPHIEPTQATAEVEAAAPIDQEFLDQLAKRDSWFHSHFAWAPGVIVDLLNRLVPVGESKVLDFGCGDGIMATGVARFARELHGVELRPYYWRLEERLAEALDGRWTPRATDMRIVDPLKPLPYPDGSFDAAFAWSVFEHVDDVPRALGEIHRVLRPGGAFLLQINPMYRSAHGAHLWNVIDEPWVHLKLTEEELLDRVRTATLKSEVEEGDTATYQGLDAEGYRDGLFDCIKSLNKITLEQLARDVQEAGFTTVFQENRRTLPHEPTAELLERFSRDDLTIDDVTMLLSR